ncbi:hypothetical protein R3P38DRAFT_2795372 [Favolaschia claudopus]|uniref:Uncharacterized protein n=1 Tax=Favolaschia claudopus TaxID=2862362 RepID=A0AAW0A7Q8_9AGAR
MRAKRALSSISSSKTEKVRLERVSSIQVSIMSKSLYSPLTFAQFVETHILTVCVRGNFMRCTFRLSSLFHPLPSTTQVALQKIELVLSSGPFRSLGWVDFVRPFVLEVVTETMWAGAMPLRTQLSVYFKLDAVSGILILTMEFLGVGFGAELELDLVQDPLIWPDTETMPVYYQLRENSRTSSANQHKNTQLLRVQHKHTPFCA